MSKRVMNALRLIAAVVIGYAIFYAWTTIRVEDDILLPAGVGITAGLIAFLFLYFTGRGGGSE